MRTYLFAIFFFSFIHINFAQQPQKPNSAQIYESIQKLNFLGSVLYIAAHPDDENTQLISYFSNQIHAQTAYLSLTRGDGGQNLIGTELRELLGVIRTEELLQARKIDGGIQFFTRANDFGFSKNPDETLRIWNKDQVLSDLVYVIRTFQPDIVINRFDHRSPGTTHGHHTSSAMLSVEGFDKAADQNAFPEQLKQIHTWQPKRLFFNQSWWFYGSREKFEKANKKDLFTIDVETFLPTWGLSNSEIAALSRSRHSTQGFGVTATRGKTVEYLEPLKGDLPKNDLFEGIDTTWNRLKGGKEIGEILYNVQANFDFKNPSASVPELLKAYQLILKLEDPHWRKIKVEEIKNIIESCSGLYLESLAESPSAVSGQDLTLNFEAINRSDLDISLHSISINEDNFTTTQKLETNVDFQTQKKFRIPDNQTPSTPYWLEESGTIGMYKVTDPSLISLPETPPAFSIKFNLFIDGTPIELEKTLVYKYNDDAKGEVYKPFFVVPKVSIQLTEKNIIFNDEKPKKVAVNIKSLTDKVNGNLTLKLDKEWKISPEFQQIELNSSNEETTVWFEITPPTNISETTAIPQLTIGNQTFDKELIEIRYDHIPAQNVLLSGAAKFNRIDLKKRGNKVGYIMGAGDEIPENLRQIGYEVELISPQNITAEKLKNYDAIVVGIRAFNVIPDLSIKNKILFEYVNQGGNLVVQYNTYRDLLTSEIAPFELKLSPNRVTDENSNVEFLDKNHPVLNDPNPITKQDFEGWVQERGLYFPNQWSREFEPILSMHDDGESAMDGSLLVAKYGKGYYIYTGLSFFRELPAGVPGAYRLFANLLSIGK